ncbi:hypothetical protein HaLaN_11048 [Haematococcus lacustris]|uniref:Uncharacterized protein n=1 Tax=Haematococcus lacustris TaxID=44745 RepID=A0A699YZ12_HAELA|nr:hypothetical protein HaLaN_11048 [Haematococcus lacustris]
MRAAVAAAQKLILQQCGTLTTLVITVVCRCQPGAGPARKRPVKAHSSGTAWPITSTPSCCKQRVQQSTRRRWGSEGEWRAAQQAAGQPAVMTRQGRGPRGQGTAHPGTGVTHRSLWRLTWPTNTWPGVPVCHLPPAPCMTLTTPPLQQTTP